MKHVFVFILLVLPLLASDPAQLNSEPADWALLKSSARRLELPGVFSAELPSSLKWQLVIDTKGPGGSPFHMWEIRDDSGKRNGLLLVLDIDIGKLDEAEREAFMVSFFGGYMRSAVTEMEKKKYKLAESAITDYCDGGPHAKRAYSDFQKDEDHQYNITYALALRRIYLIGYEGSQKDLPKWFSELQANFKKI
jgi:hypothetical protein